MYAYDWYKSNEHLFVGGHNEMGPLLHTPGGADRSLGLGCRKGWGSEGAPRGSLNRSPHSTAEMPALPSRPDVR